MKKLLAVALFVFPLAAFAQKLIIVEALPQAMDKDTQVSFIVEIPQASFKDVEKDWLKYVGKGSKGKAVVTDDIYHQSGAFNGNISPWSFEVHSRLMETSPGVRLTAWFTQNNSPFISQNSNSDSHLAAQKYLRDFAIQEYRQAVQNELKTEQDKLNEMEKELIVLNSDEEKSVKKIRENDRSNVRANEAIVTTNTDILSSSGKIYDQKEMVEQTASDPKATRGAKKTLSDLENDKKDLQDANEKQNKNIDERDKENREEERSVDDTRQHQEVKTADIEKQREKVYSVQTKLDNIK